jgi:glycosyltransferase involved in cell wall biosynthesis
MKILVITQIVDVDDPVLGFFHRWLEEFSSSFEKINVICLKKGEIDLPENIAVHSLGKEGGRSRVKYIFRFYKYIWKMRGDYNAVFVHMNEEYVMLGGLMWRLLGKKIVMWRNFRTGSWMTPIASKLADTVCYTSNKSFTARYKNSVLMPMGIDTDFFKPAEQASEPNTLLFLGRLDSIKRPEVFIEALKLVKMPYSACLCGSPTYEDDQYANSIKKLAEPLVEKGSLILRKGVTNREARDLYQENAIYVNLTPSGSFDKTIGEAAACGCLVICSNEAMEGVVPSECIVDDAPGLTHALNWTLGLTRLERDKIGESLRSYVVENHSLKLLVKKLITIIE